MFLFILFMCLFQFHTHIPCSFNISNFLTFSNHLSLQFKNGYEILQVIPLGKPLARNIFHDHF